jgi:copper chaperone CopZ
LLPGFVLIKNYYLIDLTKTKLKMKKLSLLLLISFLFALTTNAQTKTVQNKKEDIKEIKIKAAFHCPNGKAQIETGLAKEAGVKSVVADLDSKVVTVKYDAAITDKNKINAAIEKIGYTTEFTPADKKINKACTH